MSGPPGWAPVAGLLARVRSLYRSIVTRAESEQGVRDEFEHHIAMHTERLVRSGMDRRAAEKQARVEFGHAESHRVDARAARGLRWYDQLRVSVIDVKLGLRMLVKHPLISIAAVLALAVGIPVGLAPSHLASAVESPLPGDPQHRIRAIRLWDAAAVGVASAQFADFDYWTRELKAFSTLAAFRALTVNVSRDAGRAEPVEAAQISARTFDVLGVVPERGRPLNADDFTAGAAPVVLIGQQFWQTHFAGDRDVVGQMLRVGRVLHTVVGVMPDGFRFPSYAQLWLPMGDERVAANAGSANVQIVGRLAEGTSAAQAQTALNALAAPPPSDAADADRRARLRPEVVPFGLLFMGLPASGLAAMPEFLLVQLLMLVVLLVACGNVAMLVFAQTATRFKEIAIRTALGASRTRVVSQIFVETFILALLSAAVGVFLVDWALGHVNLAAIGGQTTMPYWLRLDVTPGTLIRAVLLATVSATAAGVIPAIGITGRAVHQNIRGSSGVKFGRLTGALVIADIAVAVAAVGLSLAIMRQVTDMSSMESAAGIPAAEYMAVEFRSVDDAASDSGATRRALLTALRAEPGVRGVAVANALPMMEQRSRPIEIEGVEVAGGAQEWVRSVTADIDYFRGLGRSVTMGRDFDRSDIEGSNRRVIVNTAFVDRLLSGADPIGRRIRFTARTQADRSEWYEIIGVVPHLGINMVNAESGEAVYVPAALQDIAPMQVAIQAGAAPMQLSPLVRELAQSIDPDLLMGTPTALTEFRQGDWYLVLGLGGGLMLLAAVLVALAASGLFAMLSLTVTERTREIGIRAALGATPRALVWTVLRRSLWQIGLGALIGLPLAAYFVSTVVGDSAASPLLALLIAVGLAAGIVGVIAFVSCAVPVRRVLAIEASIAMRAEA